MLNESLVTWVEGHRVEFDGTSTITIGRDADCQLRVAPDDRRISRHHAVLTPRAGGWHWEDTSTRGSFVEGARVTDRSIQGPVTFCLGAPDGPPVRLDVARHRSDDDSRPNHPPVGAAVGNSSSGFALPTDGGQGTLMVGAGASVAQLLVQIAGRQLVFPVGSQVRIGRDPTLEVVASNPLVSRNYHGLLEADSDGATYTDVSSRGTYLNGRRLIRPLRITESVALRLGDPATGEELAVTPPLPASRIQSNRRRRITKRRVAIGASVAAGVGTLGFALGGIAPRPGPPSLSDAALKTAKSATVRLLMGTTNDATGWGSGTVVSSDGLILTNGHVAAPQAPGEAVWSGAPGSTLEADPKMLTVEFTNGDASSVTPKYLAKAVAVDGYLDLAIIKIYATADGTPVDPRSLHLPFLELGDVSKLELNQPVTVLGFPGVAQSDSLTVTSGVISTFVPDPLHHVPDRRFQLETTARVAHGNSGGAAIDNTGRLVGVPSLIHPGQDTDISWRLRSVTEAEPLLAAARAGREYQTPWVQPLHGTEQVASIGVGATDREACSGNQSAASGSSTLVVGFQIAGFSKGTDIELLVIRPDGRAAKAQFTTDGHDGCLPYPMASGAQLPAGTYTAALLAGPNLDLIGREATLTVGSGGNGNPPGGTTQ